MRKRRTLSLMVVALIIICFFMGMLTYRYIDNDFKLPKIPALPIASAIGTGGSNSFSLSIGYNMVSMPKTISKYNVSITYNDIGYSWNQAVNDGLIADIVIYYDGIDYVETDTFLKTKGYWMYSLVEPLYISDEEFVLYCGTLLFNGTEDITCDRIVIAPEFYDNTISVASLTVTNMYEFYFDGLGYTYE